MELKATHVITSLHADGAQQALLRILTALATRAARMNVVSLRDEGSLGDALISQGIPVQTLGMRGGLRAARGAARLVRLLRKQRPDVVVTWLYHGDLAGGVAAKLAGRRPVVWNVRHSGLADSSTGPSTRLASAACCRLARRVPDAIVFCSERSRDEHVARGYPASRSIVIPNGFEFATFCPRPGAVERVRAELELPTRATLVGHFGRYHAAKDHATLLSAAARVAVADEDVHFVLCGRDVDANNAVLVETLRKLALTNRCHLLGHRPDVAELMAAMDVVVSSSRTEGFPNAIGEALACGVPCVGTDVGDTRRIIGPGGAIVPPREARTLAAAILRLLERPPVERQRIGELGRRHVEAYFEISRLAEEHLNVWTAAAAGAGAVAALRDEEPRQRNAA
jgi:glycosyltransferase involved in cell wall biosynthesis